VFRLSRAPSRVRYTRSFHFFRFRSSESILSPPPLIYAAPLPPSTLLEPFRLSARPFQLPFVLLSRLAPFNLLISTASTFRLIVAVSHCIPLSFPTVLLAFYLFRRGMYLLVRYFRLWLLSSIHFVYLYRSIYFRLSCVSFVYLSPLSLHTYSSRRTHTDRRLRRSSPPLFDWLWFLSLLRYTAPFAVLLSWAVYHYV